MPEKEIIVGNSLEVIAPDKSRRTVRIVDSPFLIGRGDETGNHVQLDDPRISRRCAAIITEGKRCLLEDSGHRRGIFVNGKKIENYVLSNGDVIDFGYEDSYEIIFHVQSAEKPIQSMLTLMGGVSPKDNPTSGLGKLNLLLEATSLLHSDLPLDSVLSTMLDYAVSITKADRALLLEVGSSGALETRLARAQAPSICRWKA